MATIRAYTTIEQSRKLAEILPLESADMYYDRAGLPSLIDKYVTHESIKNDKYHHLIPCWSLASLLGVLPNIIKGVHFKTLSFLYEWHCAYMNGNGEILTCDTSADNPVDACVEMIIKLNELNLL